MENLFLICMFTLVNLLIASQIVPIQLHISDPSLDDHILRYFDLSNTILVGIERGPARTRQRTLLLHEHLARAHVHLLSRSLARNTLILDINVIGLLVATLGQLEHLVMNVTALFAVARVDVDHFPVADTVALRVEAVIGQRVGIEGFLNGNQVAVWT